MQPIRLMLDVLLLADPWSASGSAKSTVYSFIDETQRFARMPSEQAVVQLFDVIARPIVPESAVVRTCEQLNSLFRAICQRVEQEIWIECRALMHEDYHEPLAWTDRLPNDPVILRAEAFPPHRPSTIAGQRHAYDARLLYFLSYRILQLLLENDRWYREMLRADVPVPQLLTLHTLYPERVHGQCVEELQRFGVLNDRRRNVPTAVDAPLDPDNEDRCARMEHASRVNETWKMVRVPFNAYQLACETDDTVSVETRIKSLFRLWSKWTREQARVDLPYVPDAVGARIILLTDERYHDIVTFISDRLEPHVGGTVLRRRPRHEEADRVPNRFAAPTFHAETFRTEFGGLRTEVQVMTLSQAVNIAYSGGEERSTRYRLRQLWPLLPVLRPRELWEMEWFNQLVFDKCDRFAATA